MSAWGVSNFENDTALDWIESVIIEGEDLDIKSEVFDFLEDFHPEETSLQDCCKFLTIAELIAALIGHPAEDIPEEMTDWVQNQYIQLEVGIIKKAQEGVNKILVNSEAKEMYLDSGYFKTWEKIQRNLIKRLQA